MKILSAKSISRLRIVVTGGVFRLVNLFSNLLISIFIVRMESPVLWGDIVYYILLLDLGFTIINWGHAPYLLREFSAQPHKQGYLLSQSFFSRSLIVILFSVVLILTVGNGKTSIFLVLWTAARFAYQSFDPVVQAERNFIYSIIAELIGIAIVLIPLIFSWVPASLDNLILLYAFSFITRSILMITHYSYLITSRQVFFTVEFLRLYFFAALPFFIVTLSAMLQQRAGLYVVTFLLPKEDIAQYQVFLNLLVLAQLSAGLIISPFAKSIYRLSDEVLKKLEHKFIRAGLFLSFFSMVVIYILIELTYQFHFNATMYMMGYFYILFGYFYLIKSYELGKNYNHYTIATYCFIGCVVNVLLSFILIPIIGQEGAMLAGLSTQILTTFIYHMKYFTRYSYKN